MIDLSEFNIEVEKRSAYSVNENGIIIPSSKHIAIVRKDNNEIVHFPTKTYEIVPNKEVIDAFMEAVTPITSNIVIDNKHTFVTSGRMSIHLRFPDFKINDGTSDIDFSMYLDNSYDGSTGMRLIFGGIRAICTNGMIWGKEFEKIYGRHTVNIRRNVQAMRDKLDSTMNKFPEIEKRINLLKQDEFWMTEENAENLTAKFGVNLSEYMINESGQVISKYDLMNLATYYVSHVIDVKQRQNYQQKISNFFHI